MAKSASLAWNNAKKTTFLHKEKQRSIRIASITSSEESGAL
jgi:hypothetical protein